MEESRRFRRGLLTTMSLLGGIAVGLVGCHAHPGAAVGPLVCAIAHEQTLTHYDTVTPGRPDLSGYTRVGKASFYAHSFAHRVMADGRRMNPKGDNAASRTLPLGTTAKVINIRTGQSAIVAIEDRGPYVTGRIVDLSPATARRIGITRHIGVAEVKVAPIAVRMPDGSTKSGSGAWHAADCRVASS